MEFNFVYVNCTDQEEAKKIGRYLVEKKMAASANIFNQTLSYYYWEGTLREDPETTLVLFIREAHLQEIVEEIKKQHSYECPCIVALPIATGNPEFVDWMERVIPTNLSQAATE